MNWHLITTIMFTSVHPFCYLLYLIFGPSHTAVCGVSNISDGQYFIILFYVLPLFSNAPCLAWNVILQKLLPTTICDHSETDALAVKWTVVNCRTDSIKTIYKNQATKCSLTTLCNYTFIKLDMVYSKQ